MTEIYFKEQSYQIIGLCMNVHSALGQGFKETIYKDALMIEFKTHNIPVKREKKYTVTYKDLILPHFFVADFVAFDQIIIEVKATPYIGNPFIRQTVNYLKASGLKLGLLINFGAASLEYKRVVF